MVGGFKVAEIKRVDNNKWLLSEKSIEIGYGFSKEKGVYIYSFKVKSEAGDAEYCYGENSITPIINTDNGEENQRPPFEWQFISAEYGEKTFNKRPVMQLDIVMEVILYRLTFHAVVFPGVSVIKQWWDCENTSVARTNGFTIKPFAAEFKWDDYRKSYWFTSFGGGHTRPTQGDMITRMIGSGQVYKIGGYMSGEYVPLFTVCCEEAPYDGFMASMDYLGEWSMELKGTDISRYSFEFVADGGKQMEMLPKEKMELPGMIFAAFNGNHDALMETVYDWQYRYMFDLTKDKYYCATKNFAHWYYGTKVLSEQFAHRSAMNDMDCITTAQHIGARGAWSDAGWYAHKEGGYGYIFLNSLDGPDFRESIKYANKCDIGYTLWFAGKPLDGIMSSKANYWGDFEWRTDAINSRNQVEYNALQNKVSKFLEGHPDRSFHGCSGGGKMEHTFGMQRLTTFNYDSDCNASPYLNYYLSYFELPDKHQDMLDCFGEGVLKYNGASTLGCVMLFGTERHPDKDYRFARMTNLPTPGTGGNRKSFAESNFDYARENLAIYEYMKRKGVAGRFSYSFHPAVYGDKEYYYRLRCSNDKKRAALIISRGCGKSVRLLLNGLLEDEEYTVIFNSSGERFKALGKTLINDGLCIENFDKSDIVWFNLSDYPFGAEAPSTKAPIAVYKREENNIKTKGVGIYIAAEDDDGRFYFAIRRNGRLVQCQARGTFWFDYSPEADINAEYTVAAVGLNRQEGEPIAAKALDGKADCLSALGSFSGEVENFRGFSHEYSEDGINFMPMKRIPSKGLVSGDWGMSPNREGGIDGNFEASGNTRIGRGYHQVGDKIAAKVYTAEEDQTVRVTGCFARDHYNRNSSVPVKGYICKNGEKLWSCRIAAGKNEFKKHDITVELKKGDKLRFVTDKAKMPRVQIYQFDDDAVNVSWMPLITKVEEKSYSKGIFAISTSGKDEKFGGSKFVGQKLDAADGRITLDISTDAILNDVMLVFDSEDEYMDEGYVTAKLNGRTVADGFDVVRERNSANAPVVKQYRSVVAVDGKVKLDVEMSGKAKLLYIAMTPANEMRGFYALGTEKYIDWSGDIWEKPVISGGMNSPCNILPEQAMPTLYDEEFYKTARAGKDFETELTVPDGIYTVRILTSNTRKFDGRAPEFDIFINGQLVEEDFNTDGFADGANLAICLKYDGIIPENGKIKVRFKATGKAPAVVTAIALD